MATTEIVYVVGDATDPKGDEPKIIVHVCNDVGGWGRGFVVALSDRWEAPELSYRAWAQGNGTPFGLGEVQLVEVDADRKIWVANMVAQHDITWLGGRPPIRYDALKTALLRVVDEAKKLGASVHMPRIGCGLAGGSWGIVGRLIEETLCGADIHVTVYDLPL